jgi:hypothetical protein
METEITTNSDNKKEYRIATSGGNSGAVYGLGMIGAWVFYISKASNFQEGVIGFLKGLVWPAYLVYGALTFLDKHNNE